MASVSIGMVVVLAAATGTQATLGFLGLTPDQIGTITGSVAVVLFVAATLRAVYAQAADYSGFSEDYLEKMFKKRSDRKARTEEWDNRGEQAYKAARVCWSFGVSLLLVTLGTLAYGKLPAALPVLGGIAMIAALLNLFDADFRSFFLIIISVIVAAGCAAVAVAAGASIIGGSSPALTLTDSATPGSFNQAGQVISYSYKVSNTGAGTLTGIAVTDPAVPGVSCRAASLVPGASEICTGSYTTTSADLAAGKVTDTATAATATGVPVNSNPATVTVPEGWPPLVSGIDRPAAHAAEGYYLGVTGSTWSLIVTHPDNGKVVFTGTVTLNAGAFRNLTPVQLESSDSSQASHKTLTFHLANFGDIDGVRFATSPADTAITFTLNIGGHPAAASQIFLGGAPTHPRNGSPLAFHR
jgi:uncharacterized repeat protein (TIGR01451 family)